MATDRRRGERWEGSSNGTHGGRTTELLRSWNAGRDAALDCLIDRIYGRLRRLAHVRLRQHRREGIDHTTELVHELYLRWRRSPPGCVDGRQLFGVAGRGLAQVQIDQVRRWRAAKRGGGWRQLSWSSEIATGRLGVRPIAAERLAVRQALERLCQLDARKARIVVHRTLLGRTIAETALALGLSTATVERDLRVARAWLAMQLRCASETG